VKWLGEPVDLVTFEGVIISEWFNELHAGRQYGWGPQPLAWSEIDAWARLTRRRLTYWVIARIREIDNIFLRLRSEADKEK